MNTQREVEDRLDSERRFHNDRFAEETRVSVQPFYQVIENCFDDYNRKIHEYSKGSRVLEYGCAKGENALSLAADCQLIHGIDISDVAIEKARAAALARGINNAKFDVMNAEELCFEDASFDLIFGSGIIHHLDIKKAYHELARVLRPGGVALFVEPLGHNPLINRFRNKTPDLRTPDEHPLMRQDIELAKQYFDRVDVKLYGLAALAAIPVIRSSLARPLMLVGKTLDNALLRLPGLRWWAWYSLIQCRKSK